MKHYPLTQLLPGTEVHARGLRWEVVTSERLGPQTLYRLRGVEHAVLGHEFDLLSPFEAIEPVQHALHPERAAPLTNWLVYHQAFLLEQALGPSALLAVQPGRLRLEPYQLVPVLRAIRMSRARLLLADGVGLGKTIQAGLILTELVTLAFVTRLWRRRASDGGKRRERGLRREMEATTMMTAFAPSPRAVARPGSVMPS